MRPSPSTRSAQTPRLPGPCGGPVSWPARCTPFPITRATRPGRVWPLPCVRALPISCPTPSCACTCAACRGSVCQPHGISPRSTVVCVVRHPTRPCREIHGNRPFAPPDAHIQTRSPSDPSHFPRTAPRFPTPRQVVAPRASLCVGSRHRATLPVPRCASSRHTSLSFITYQSSTELPPTLYVARH